MLWCQCQGAQNIGLPNHELKSALLKRTVWSQCTPVPDRRTDVQTDEHHGNSATIRSNEHMARYYAVSRLLQSASACSSCDISLKRKAIFKRLHYGCLHVGLFISDRCRNFKARLWTFFLCQNWYSYKIGTMSICDVMRMYRFWKSDIYPSLAGTILPASASINISNTDVNPCNHFIRFCTCICSFTFSVASSHLRLHGNVSL